MDPPEKLPWEGRQSDVKDLAKNLHRAPVGSTYTWATDVNPVIAHLANWSPMPGIIRILVSAAMLIHPALLAFLGLAPILFS